MVSLVRIRTIRFYRAYEAVRGLDMPEGYSVSSIDHQDAFPWSEYDDSENAELYRARFARGHTALLGRHDRRRALLAWVARGALDVDELRWHWKLHPDHRCVYDVVTYAAFRGRGFYPATLAWLAAEVDAEGSRNAVWIYCESSNAASRRGIEKAGYRFVGQAHALWMRSRLVLRTGMLPGGAQ